MDRKPFTMIFVFKDSFNRIIKIENVKESKTYEGAVYAVTEDETYICPLNGLLYVRMLKGKESEGKNEVEEILNKIKEDIDKLVEGTGLLWNTDVYKIIDKYMAESEG